MTAARNCLDMSLFPGGRSRSRLGKLGEPPAQLRVLLLRPVALAFGAGEASLRPGQLAAQENEISIRFGHGRGLLFGLLWSGEPRRKAEKRNGILIRDTFQRGRILRERVGDGGQYICGIVPEKRMIRPEEKPAVSHEIGGRH